MPLTVMYLCMLIFSLSPEDLPGQIRCQESRVALACFNEATAAQPQPASGARPLAMQFRSANIY